MYTHLGAPAGIVDRRVYLRDRCRGRRVVHLGCADEGLTSERAGTGNLLHEELAKVATALVGVDISAAALATLQQRVPGTYVTGDVEHLEDVDLPDECDLVVAAELIEHLGRPAEFLAGLRAYLERTGATALITTPNAYSWVHWMRFAVGRSEWVHPDHRCLFSPATLLHSAELAGLRNKVLYVHAWDRSASAKDVVDRLALRANPWLGPGLVLEVTS